MAPRTRNIAKRLRRRHDDERDAELVEFALVVVLLITLLYGIITWGLILASQSTITQAAADAARAGIVQGSAPPTTCNGVLNTSSAGCAAVEQAATDVGWMNKGACKETVNGALIQSSAGPISCSASIISCPSVSINQCLSVTVSYAYSSSPLFPELPGLGLITPSTISSTNVLQLSTPSGS